MKQPIGSALSMAKDIIDQPRSDGWISSVQDAVAAIRDFAQIEFNVPSGPDSDGFLFQYCEVNWFSESTFTLGFVRQMELVGAEVEHEGYL
ncbi:hypothetical protein NE857_14930 [Nocardiopsis exhalans]|uniref:Uncharacterized protein n=2 Tax=Nocardiopsis TaxID=2013 RepID=A0A840WA10_9ACTN|nr:MULTISPECIES: hypothetical protein [Nocardiopsis]MBB5489891.1 hypothetical protein [Nocardiopsis metallicus]USY22788.1 hypothetical protein NE857_14930 [Nocardiopsis exhalans]